MSTPDNWPVARTSDGVLIIPGLIVRDYNYNITTVTDRKPDMDNGNPWFFTANNGYFDGSRLTANDPRTGKPFQLEK